MFHRLWRKWKRRAKHSKAVNPDEIFLASSNLPAFDRDQFEGRIETPIAKRYLSGLLMLFVAIVSVFLARAVYLEGVQGGVYATRAARNSLKKEIIFAHRGLIADRNDISLSWNEESTSTPFAKRAYTKSPGFSNILGFVKYPGEDSSGNLYSFYTAGQDGVEKYFDARLRGENGAKLTEVSVKGEIESQGTLEPAQAGEKLMLSLDSRVQEALYNQISDAALKSGFKAGAGVIMDARTGEVLASVSYPGYDENVMTAGSDKEAIEQFLTSEKEPFLDRASAGLYAPGSIVKPFVAAGVLQEKIINPEKQIFTVGYISLPNPYDPDNPSISKDWKDHGYVDMKRALAVSSDAYFYIVGGGFGAQKGLGINKIDEYMKIGRAHV